MKLIEQILEKTKKETFIIQLKSRILLYLSLAGIGLVVLYVIVAFISGADFAIMPVIIIVLLVLAVLLVKFFKYKIAGNFISIVLVVSQMLSTFPNFSSQQPFDFFIDEFYFSIAFLVISAVFATELVLLFNTLFIIIVSIIIFYTFKVHYDEKTAELANIAFWNFQFILIVIFISLYGLQKIFKKTIEFANNETIMRIKQNEQMQQIIKKVKIGATILSKTSTQQASISKHISENANEQASTIEEVASSMEQMISMISSNTQNAEITGQSSEKSAKEMQQSNEIFVQTIKSVSEISEKISIISEIADKTDILSINAAIEAARAGDSGKGFAVVAQEIRKLADKTKMASDEITVLSKSGQDISKIAGEKLSKTIPKIIKSAELVNNIVLASKEQQSGAENINTSIEQLAEITNENSASAEEMSASAEELSAQAEQLKELISVFKIGNVDNK